MIPRTLFTPDHEAFRDSFRRFCEKEIAPHHDAWEEQGYVDRAVWNKAGENGFLCMTMPEEYGGSGADKLYSVIQFEELNARGLTGIGYSLHSEIVAPYLLHYGTPEQKAKYLPKLARGEMIGAIAMSEPAAGSDLQGIKSTAIKQADGSYLLNGSKTFITNGWHADLVIVVAKTNPEAGGKGTSLLLVETEHQMMACGQEVMIVADSTKFGRQSLAWLCGLERIQHLVVDQGLSENHRGWFRHGKVQIHEAVVPAPVPALAPVPVVVSTEESPAYPAPPRNGPRAASPSSLRIDS